MDRRLPTVERRRDPRKWLARTRAVAPPSRVGHKTDTIKLLAGAGPAINQMCPPKKKNYRSRGRTTATVPAGRYICCKGIGLLASVPLSILCRGPGMQENHHSRRHSPRNPIECFARLAQAPCHRLVYSCCRYCSVRLGRANAVGGSAWRRPKADGDDCMPTRSHARGQRHVDLY